MFPLPVSELNQSGSNAPLVKVPSASDFTPLTGKGASRYRHTYSGGRHLDSLLLTKNSDTLIVQFHGAVNRKKVNLPRFERLATLSTNNSSAMFFADPGLWIDPDISISWFTGWVDANPQQDIAHMITQTASSIGASKIIIVGDSGGGFAALQVSALIPDSVCLAFDPTTTIHKYYTSGNYRRTEVQQRYVETIHPEALTELNGKFDPSIDWTINLGDEVSVLKRYSKKTSNYVLFLQNVNDWHHQQHYLPFLGACARGDNLRRIRALEYEGKNGHHSPSLDLYLSGLRIAEDLAALCADGLGLDDLQIPNLNSTLLQSANSPSKFKEKKKVTRRKIVLPESTFKFPSIKDFQEKSSSEQLETGTYSIGDPTAPIIAQWNNINSPVTLVTFSAALTKNAAPTVPIFSGRRTTNGLNANVLMLSDPSLILNSELMLSWYAGNAELGGIQSMISSIIDTFRSKTRLVLFGASGGGFAALDQALRLSNSTALVINPQTDITKYPYFGRYLELACGGVLPSSEEGKTPINTQVLGGYCNPTETRVLYIQNIEDTHHFKEHMKPFRARLHPDNAVRFIEKDLGKGHFGPDADSMRRLFEAVTAEPDWVSLQNEVLGINLISVKK